MFLGTELHLSELRGPHTRSSDISNFACFDKVMQCFHGLLDRRFIVKSMDLKEIYVRSFQTREGSVDGIEDCLARESYKPSITVFT
jgi:hypothetical protein